MHKLILLLLILTSIQAKDIKLQEIISVYDGDTVTANISSIYKELEIMMPIRLKGIDTPEIRGKCHKEIILAMKAKSFLMARIKRGNSFELKNVTKGKYFRIVGTLYIDGIDVNQELIKAGLARRYNGQTKRMGWCGK